MILNVIYAPVRCISSSSSALAKAVLITHYVKRLPSNKDWFRFKREWNETGETACGKSIHMIPVEFVIGSTVLCALCQKSTTYMIEQYWTEEEVTQGRVSFVELHRRITRRSRKSTVQDTNLLFVF